MSSYMTVKGVAKQYAVSPRTVERWIERGELTALRLGLSQVGAARHMGYSDRTVRRWAAGAEDVPRIVQLYLALARPEDVRSER